MYITRGPKRFDKIIVPQSPKVTDFSGALKAFFSGKLNRCKICAILVY